MLAVARRRVAAGGLDTKIELHEGRAETLPFPDETFDALTVTYLFRYVDDPGATLRELARVVRPGGTVALLEFGVPQSHVARALWELYVRLVLPLAGRILSRAGTRWDASSARASATSTPAAARAPARALDGSRARRPPRAAAQPRRRPRRLGPARMTSETRPAFYALARGGWRDYVTLLHPPYTLWHLSYVAIGAALAPEFEAHRLLWGLAAFLLALGVGAHALDELHGRPLATAIPRSCSSGSQSRLSSPRSRSGSAPRRMDALAAPVRRRRRLPRSRLHARARRRHLPQRSLVRARLGSLPRADGISGRGGGTAA